MHSEVMDFCNKVKNRFPEKFIKKDVLDVGSLDINGNNRYLFTDCRYAGIDLVKGNNVDYICHATDMIGSYDVVISTEALEHDYRYIETIHSVSGLTRSKGLLLITCATEPRPEHGTDKTNPNESPATSNYYRNINPNVFMLTIENLNCFSEYAIEINKNHGDLYFWGIKK